MARRTTMTRRRPTPPNIVRIRVFCSQGRRRKLWESILFMGSVDGEHVCPVNLPSTSFSLSAVHLAEISIHRLDNRAMQNSTCEQVHTLAQVASPASWPPAGSVAQVGSHSEPVVPQRLDNNDPGGEEEEEEG